jgi:hypothetical protein
MPDPASRLPTVVFPRLIPLGPSHASSPRSSKGRHEHPWLTHDQLGDRSALRRQVVLTESRLDHVPAFRQVFVDRFGIRARVLPEEPAWSAPPPATCRRWC